MLKVISFNIRCCDDKNGNSIKERAKRLEKVTCAYNADIIGFQEFRPDWEERIKEIYGEKYGIFYIYRAKDELEASPILWKKDRFSAISIDYFWLSDTPNTESKGWDELYDCYRMCVCIKFFDKETDEFFYILNTHFGFGDSCQVKSVKLIKKYCEKFSGEPICIVGDFNMQPDSIGYRDITRHFFDVNTLTENDLRNTYHGYYIEGVEGEHIDYCFINKGFSPKCRRLIDETVDGMYPSDHYGLYMELEFNN